ncbi:hypothetical protein B0H19DRAFT_1079673 [Mycena capillaripes]|nr:hypothetical protein B0H19DRAFT_1079673 [Mycena capillaripes]
MTEPKLDKHTALAKILYSGFFGSLVVLGFAAYIVAHYDTKAIAIAHIVLSIFVMIFLILALCAYSADPSASGGLFMLNFLIYLVLMIVMVADPHTRQQTDSEGQNYFSGNQTESVKRTVSKGGLTIAFKSGPFLGLLIGDCLGIGYMMMRRHHAITWGGRPLLFPAETHAYVVVASIIPTIRM